MKLLAILTITAVFINHATCAKILGIAPTPSFSHQVVYRPLWIELSLRGHDLTVLTADPLNNATLTNLTEIDLHPLYEIWNKHDLVNFHAENQNNLAKIMNKFIAAFSEMIEWQMNLPKVQDLLLDADKNKFDLVIAETVFPSMCAFAEKYGCPCVGIMSMEVNAPFHRAFGNPTHPALYPETFTSFVRNLSFLERVMNSITFVVTRFLEPVYNEFQNEAVKRYFGRNASSVEELIEKMSMLLLNLNPILSPARPVVPATVLVGGKMHITPPKSLPQDLQKILDEATNGVIYFSMGSNAKSKDFPSETKQILVNTFRQLPYTVLWKYEDDVLPGRTDNIKIFKWLPQQDVLRHQNIRVFFTQCGAQSMEESIFSGVPIVCMPFFSDQRYNAKWAVMKGFGLLIDRREMNVASLKSTILEVINNPKYHENVNKAAKLSLDQPMTGLERAVWWVEYVIRHKDTKHLRGTAVDLPFYKYFLLDIIGFVVIVVLAVGYLIFKLSTCILFIIRRIFKRRNKQKEL